MLYLGIDQHAPQITISSGCVNRMTQVDGNYLRAAGFGRPGGYKRN